MIPIRATTNVDEVIAKLDDWTATVVQVATTRAVNALIRQARTAGLRRINDIYRIGPRTFEKYATVSLADQGRFEASISVKGKGLPLYLFQPRTVGKPGRRGRKGGGVSVNLKGRRFLIPHAFIARMRTGHVGVFARGAYGGKSDKFEGTGEKFGRFQFGRNRLSINELFTFSAPGAFSNPDVTEAMEDRVNEQAAAVWAREVRFATR